MSYFDGVRNFFGLNKPVEKVALKEPLKGIDPFKVLKPEPIASGPFQGCGYEVGRTLGQGAYGIVYLGQTTATKTDKYGIKTNETVYSAIKALLDDDIEWAEIAALSSVDSPNVIPLRGLLGDKKECKVGQTIPMVLPFGVSLMDKIGTLSYRELMKATFDLLNGLYVLHRSGCLHNDIKEPNCIYIEKGGEGHYCIADLGAAAWEHDPRKLIHGFYKVFIGTTYAYRNPLSLLDNLSIGDDLYPLSINSASDVFSLGCVLLGIWCEKPFYTLIDAPSTYQSNGVVSGFYKGVDMLNKNGIVHTIPDGMDTQEIKNYIAGLDKLKNHKLMWFLFHMVCYRGGEDMNVFIKQLSATVTGGIPDDIIDLITWMTRLVDRPSVFDLKDMVKTITGKEMKYTYKTPSWGQKMPNIVIPYYDFFKDYLMTISPQLDVQILFRCVETFLRVMSFSGTDMFQQLGTKKPQWMAAVGSLYITVETTAMIEMRLRTVNRVLQETITGRVLDKKGFKISKQTPFFNNLISYLTNYNVKLTEDQIFTSAKTIVYILNGQTITNSIYQIAKNNDELKGVVDSLLRAPNEYFHYNINGLYRSDETDFKELVLKDFESKKETGV
jgi:serine/threonine protein kinase